jgi:SAM-dependent methyltransferase
VVALTTNTYFDTRFRPDDRRTVLWRALYRHFFASLIAPADCVLELGAGYCSFINQVVARRRIALDSWEGFLGQLEPGVEGRVADATDLAFLEPASVNFVFASNLFEHLEQTALARILEQLERALAPGGTINIVQPNYRYCYREYFDDYTHVTVYSHVTMTDFLEAHGYDVFDCRPRFLPLTIKSRLPVSETLIRLYLASPVKPLGKQMLLRARLTRS